MNNGDSSYGVKREANWFYVRDFSKKTEENQLKQCYPFISRNKGTFIVPIYPDYHTELLPDSILNTESPEEFIEDFPHRNRINKVYVSRAMTPHPKRRDLLVFIGLGYYKVLFLQLVFVQERNTILKMKMILFCTAGKGSVFFPEDQLRNV